MIKNIIFDFGAVLIPLDESKTLEAFENLGAKEDLYSATDIFHAFETGKIDSAKFYSKLQPYLFRRTFSGDLKSAWNALLGDLPEENIRLLKRVKKDYRIFLLSNTNVLHIDAIKQQAGRFVYKQFENQFEKVHYSHELGLRKPNADCFETVMKESGLKAEETLMIDDKEENIETADSLGMLTWLFDPEKHDILKLTKELERIESEESVA